MSTSPIVMDPLSAESIPAIEIEKGALPGAGRPHQRHEFPASDVEVDPGEDRDDLVAAVVALEKSRISTMGAAESAWLLFRGADALPSCSLVGRLDAIFSPAFAAREYLDQVPQRCAG